MNRSIKFDPRTHVVGLNRELRASTLPERGEPMPFDGVTFGVTTMSQNSPHGGERHPDGDEILYLISGRVRVVFPDGEEEDIDIQPGDGLVVPMGVWHRVDILEPSQIAYLTPGPNNGFRPIADISEQKTAGKA